MALRRINHRKKPILLLVPRSFSSSGSSDRPPPPFPPLSRPSDDPNAAAPRPPGANPGEGPNRAASSLFQDIRERLLSSPTPPPSRRIPITPPRLSRQESAHSLEDIRRQLESFRGVSRNTGDGSSHPSSSAGGGSPSFTELLKSATANTPRPAAAPGLPHGLSAGGASPFGFDSIRQSLRNDRNPQQQRRPPRFNSHPQNIFGKEMREREAKQQDENGEDPGSILLKDYSYEELGKRLGELRPTGTDKDGKDWFSLEELQGRIAKLAELEKKEVKPLFSGDYASLRESLVNIKRDKSQKKPTMQGLSILSNITGEPTQAYLHQPPQEELLERYFHPDNMSSEEKMKLELQRVRDEFKMSENDCGSARVQIAQLTLKIKHLSSVLHKKDKHSRKGLQDMVQRRKKYLKYLRRTDWDSYCLVLSKLGLRDVPEYKAPDYKKTQPATKGKSKKSKSKKKRKTKA